MDNAKNVICFVKNVVEIVPTAHTALTGVQLRMVLAPNLAKMGRLI